MLRDASFDLVVLDELTYMIAYDYLPEDEIIHAISERPATQSVVSHRSRRWHSAAEDYGYRIGSQGGQTRVQGRHQGPQGRRLLTPACTHSDNSARDC